MAMSPAQLEALVLATIDQLRAGQPIEDDRVELKREWPDPKKPRQFAGTANRARGSSVVLIIGIDESTGRVRPSGGTDMATWWAQLSSRFDQVSPELLNHLVVHIGEGESVTVLEFATDRAPYVVKTDGGSPELEVPIRDGTRTRSARRDELVRMLVPEVQVVPAVLLESQLNGQWLGAMAPEGGRSGRDEVTLLSGLARIFLEHTGTAGILLPAHDMRGHLSGGGFEFELQPSIWAPSSKDAPPPSPFGVDARHDGVAATGPGRFAARFSVSLSGEDRDQVASVAEWHLTLSFGVTGASRRIVVACDLVKTRESEPSTPGALYIGLPQWTMKSGG